MRRAGAGACAAVVAVAAAFAVTGVAQASVFTTKWDPGAVTSAVWRANLNGGQLNKNLVGNSQTDIPTDITANGDRIYWANYGSESVGTAKTDGSGADGSFIDGPDVWPAGGVEVFGNHIYWSNDSTPSPNNGTPPDSETETIARATLDGAGLLVPGTVDLDFITGAQEIAGLSISDGYIYWVNNEPAQIGRAQLDATGAVVGTPQQDFLVIPPDPDPNQPDDVIGVAVTGNHMFWTDWRQGGVIGHVPLDGTGEPDLDEFNPEFIGGQDLPRGITTDGAHVYWTNFGIFGPLDPSVGRADLAGNDVDEYFVHGDLGKYMYGVAVQRSTSAGIGCTAAAAGATTTCTVTVTDSDLSTKTPPAGSVALATSSSAGLETPTCDLAAVGAAVSQCSFDHVLAAGGETITATYAGYEQHGPSNASAPLTPLGGGGSPTPLPDPKPGEPGHVDDGKAAAFVKALRKCAKKKTKKGKKKCKKKAKKLLA